MVEARWRTGLCKASIYHGGIHWHQFGPTADSVVVIKDDEGKALLDLDADIIPGVGAAGITIGQPIVTLSALGIGRDLTFGPVSVQADQYGMGVIDAIWVTQSYRGKVAGKIGIGSHIADVVAAFGPVEYITYGEYQLDKGTPWLSNDWTFSVGRGNPVDGEPGWQDASICRIDICADD